jgi:AraC-like DNA-binding protein
VPHIIFPVTPWQLAVGPAEPQLVTRNHAVFFNGGEAFSRRDFSGDGDVNHFMVLAPEVAEELLASLSVGGASGRFPRAVAHLAARSFLTARMVRGRLTAHVEPLEAEERLLALAADTVGTAFGGSIRVARAAPRFVEHAKALLATDVAARLTLPELACALNVSAFHLARTFRAHTGYSLHGYRLHLRLRIAADLVCDDDAELRDVAATVGFSSHSHLTSAFRRIFGIPPSVLRARAPLSGSCALSPPGCQKRAGAD